MDKVVFTNGCFDLLHVGHIRYLAAAKLYGDRLIVGLNSDESFRRHKKRNPINREAWRYEMLMALECVDEVRVFYEDTPERLLSEIKPDVLVKGPDYSPHEVLGREHAKKTICLDVGAQIHTSELIEKITASAPKSLPPGEVPRHHDRDFPQCKVAVDALYKKRDELQATIERLQSDGEQVEKL